MKRIVILMLMVSLLVLAGCSSSVNTQKNETNIKYNDISSQSKNYGERVSGNTVDIHEIRGHSGKYAYNVLFKGWKPYKKLSVMSEGFKIKIYYEEKNTKKTTDTCISWDCSFGADDKDIEVYRNGKLVEQEIRFSMGIE